MALINCPECNNQVSNQALKCPSCGKQLRKPKRTFMGKVFKCLFILFNVLMAMAMAALRCCAVSGFGAPSCGSALRPMA